MWVPADSPQTGNDSVITTVWYDAKRMPLGSVKQG